jgi:hypothetical protein
LEIAMEKADLDEDDEKAIELASKAVLRQRMAEEADPLERSLLSTTCP